MRIEAYFAQIRRIIDESPWVASSSITYDKRASHQGFLRGEIFFMNGSQLRIREYIECESSVTRLLYAYHYTDKDSLFLFRYDNTPHHKKLELPSFPHHKHEGSEAVVVFSSAPTLGEVIREIETLTPTAGAQ